MHDIVRKVKSYSKRLETVSKQRVWNGKHFLNKILIPPPTPPLHHTKSIQHIEITCENCIDEATSHK